MAKLSEPLTIYKIVLKNITISASLKQTKEFIEKYKSTHNYYLIDETWKLQEYLYFSDIDLPTPLYIEKDRYGGYYSGADYLAFNKNAYQLSMLGFNGRDPYALNFWKYEADKFCIGKGKTQSEALLNLIIKIM